MEHAHGVEGSGHLGILPSDISHDPHGLFPALAGDSSAGGISLNIFGSTTSQNPMFMFRTAGCVWGCEYGFDGLAASQLGYHSRSQRSPEDGIEIDYPLGGE
jgi:hypothetical protein